MEKRRTELLEALAEIEHEQWKSWVLNIMDTEEISKGRSERWIRLCRSYNDLSEEEKDMDRIWAEKVLWAVKKYLGIK